MNDNILIHVTDLKKTFGDHEVLKGINTTISKGEVIAIIGPSGCGKSTFLRSLNLLEVPTSGTITFEGTDITDKSVDINKMRQKIGMVFQQFNLFPNMTVKQNIMLAPVKLGIMNSEDAEKKAMELLGSIGLPDKADAYPAMLSGGQKQRAAIARALMRHPKILLADEPAASLDPVTGRQILTLLKEIQEKDGVTILMNSHNLEFSQEFSDRIIGLKDGNVVFDGTPSEMNEEILRNIYLSLEDSHLS